MKKLLISGLLLAASAAAPASAPTGDFSTSQLSAWQEYCQSELDGDAPFCDCLLKAQVSEIGAKAVHLNLNSMVVDNPSASEADIATANAAMDSVSEKEFGDTLMLFEMSLDTASEKCQG